MFYSPLRYPGGKNKLSKFIAKICADNTINGHYVEPYAGGASVALYLLLENKVAQITINDFDRSVYAFWHSVIKNTKKFCDIIIKTDVNIENWQKAKEVQKNKKKAKLLDLGFSTFFLNRANISGILDAGLIGGKAQKGKYKMDCRFNKEELIRRIKVIAKQKKRIHLYNFDALDLIKKIKLESRHVGQRSLFYFDPPYYLKGQSLYINYYKHKDHEKVSKAIQQIKNIHWIVSYDNTPEIKKIYSWVGQKKEYSLLHTAHNAKEGKEVLFFSGNLIVPRITNPVSIN
ncbi:MAG: DNA adenine methylase [Candidatus Gracilibacteria bacterium]|jgi:DNA adenine methylase